MTIRALKPGTAERVYFSAKALLQFLEETGLQDSDAPVILKAITGTTTPVVGAGVIDSYICLSDEDGTNPSYLSSAIALTGNHLNADKDAVRFLPCGELIDLLEELMDDSEEDKDKDLVAIISGIHMPCSITQVHIVNAHGEASQRQCQVILTCYVMGIDEMVRLLAERAKQAGLVTQPSGVVPPPAPPTPLTPKPGA